MSLAPLELSNQTLCIQTPVHCHGVPTLETVEMVMEDEDYIIYKEYGCVKGHEFILGFSSPINLPVCFECPECGIVAAER